MVLNGISFVSTSIRFLLSKRELLVPPSLMLMSPLDDLRPCTLKGVWQLTDACPGGVGDDWLKGGADTPAVMPVSTIAYLPQA